MHAQDLRLRSGLGLESCLDLALCCVGTGICALWFPPRHGDQVALARWGEAGGFRVAVVVIVVVVVVVVAVVFSSHASSGIG